MISFLNSQCKHDTLEELKEMWIQETRSEEKKSIKRWERKQQWLETYQKEFSGKDYTKKKESDKPSQNNRFNTDTSKYQGREQRRLRQTHNNNSHVKTYNFSRHQDTRKKEQVRITRPTPARFNKTKQHSNPRAFLDKTYAEAVYSSPFYNQKPRKEIEIQRQPYNNNQQQNHFLLRNFHRNNVPPKERKTYCEQQQRIQSFRKPSNQRSSMYHQ